jgi:hypothetical protein
MIRRVLIAAGMMVAVAAPAQAQKFEISFTGGYSTSEGISGDAIVFPAGVFDSIDVKSGGSFGLSFGYVLESGGEVGFLWGRQMSKLAVSLQGANQIDIGDMNIDHYHGYFAYNFMPDSNVHPYLMIGFGATDYGSVDFTRSTGVADTVSGPVRFSTTWGGGVKVFGAGGKVGFRGGVRWTPTYITSEAEGWWCDPWWGCYLVGDSKYANQFEFSGGIVFRFGGS